MPGLTITTGRVPSDAGATSSSVGSSGRTSGDVGAAPNAEAPQNDAPSPTRPPVSPITPTQESARLSVPGPGQHQHTTAFSSSASASSHSPTPPLTNNNNDNNTTNIPAFAQGRPTFTHSQPDQVGIPAPPPQPITFDDNPDVLALKSAITILQLQRQRATADIQALNRAKVAALEDPGAFVADLAAGRIGMAGDPLLNGPGSGGDGSSEDDDDGNDEDGDEDQDPDEDMKSEGSDGDDDKDDEEASSNPESRQDQDGDIPMSGARLSTSRPNGNTKRKIAATKKSRVNKTARQPPKDPSKTWRTLPKPQTVVRCPPINWAQYAVVGEPLDKLHREQLTAPTLGAPAVLSSGGVYEFRGTGTSALVPGGSGGGSGSGNGYPISENTTTTTTTDRRRNSASPAAATGIEGGGYPNTTGMDMGQQQQPQIPGELSQGQGVGLPLPPVSQPQQPQKLVGIAAPYTPGKDKIERKTGRKGSKR